MILHPEYATVIGGCRLDDGCEMIVPDIDCPPSEEEVLRFIALADERQVRPFALVLWRRHTGRDPRRRN